MKRLKISVVAATVAFIVSASISGAATAQVNSSGAAWQFNSSLRSAASRCVVSFPTQHAPDQLIVSFSDRRLYHIVEPGRAISYPIAVPRPENRWQDVERISYKKVNPTWTPTREMRRENPTLPRVVSGGAPENPLGVRAMSLPDVAIQL